MDGCKQADENQYCNDRDDSQQNENQAPEYHRSCRAVKVLKLSGSWLSRDVLRRMTSASVTESDPAVRGWRRNTGRFRTRSGPRRRVFGIGRPQWHEGFHRAMRMIAPEPERFAPALHSSGILCRHAFSALSNGPACLSTRGYGYHVTSALPTMSPISSPATG